MQHTSSTAYEAPQIGQRDVLIFATTVDNYHRFGYIMRISLTSGTYPDAIRHTGRVRVPAGGVTNCSRAESGLAFPVIAGDAPPLILLMLIQLLRG
jgi:hypothetical protein